MIFQTTTRNYECDDGNDEFHFLPNVKFTRGDESSDKQVKVSIFRTDFKPDMSATSRRVQRLVRLFFIEYW